MAEDTEDTEEFVVRIQISNFPGANICVDSKVNTKIVLERDDPKNPKWKDEEGNEITKAFVEQNVKLSVECDGVLEGDKLFFNIFKEEDNPKTDQPVKTIGADIKSGTAEAVWTPTDVREKGDTSKLNYFFTVTADNVEMVESGKISIKNWIQIDNLSESKNLLLVFEYGDDKTITWESKDEKIEYEQRGNVAVFCDENAYTYDVISLRYHLMYAENNKEYMVINWDRRNEEKENYYVTTVWEAWEKSIKQMDWDFFQKAIKIRNLKTNTLETIDNVDNLKEDTILITPILAESGNTTSITNQFLFNDRGCLEDKIRGAKKFENGVIGINREGKDVNPTYVYSKNYGWIDRGHAGFTTNIKKLKKLYDDIIDIFNGESVKMLHHL